MGFLLNNGAQRDSFKMYRDIFAVYMAITKENLAANGLPEDIVAIRNTATKNPNRAPAITISRGTMNHQPRSLMLNGQVSVNIAQDTTTYSTSHLLEYPVLFTCSGNSYLEAENLGAIALEVVLTSGMQGISDKHENIIGAELVAWSEAVAVEGPDSQLVATQVLAKVFIQTDGIYSRTN